MDALRHGNFRLAAILALVVAFGAAGCGGDDGDDGAPGPQGPAGADGSDGVACWDLNANGVGDPDEDLNGDGMVDVLDCNPAAGAGLVIGDGSGLTEGEVEELGQLVATIDDVTVASPPVVDFTVVDSHGNPAIGLAPGVVNFTFAKLVPGTAGFNGGLPYWQNYVNRTETPSGISDTLPQSIQATTDSSGELEELGGGKYRYTFATDVTNVTAPLAVAWEPDLLHRVGMEIRLAAPAEVPLAPDNPVFDFVPSGATPAVDSKAIAATSNCADCHFSFALHGGPRKTVEYCVTCHNPRSIDQDTGETVDMAYLAHSIHRAGGRTPSYVIYGFRDSMHDYAEVTYPQSVTFCETCHTESAEASDGDVWMVNHSAKTCGGCHAGGLVTENPDPVTGVPVYKFDHGGAGADGGFTAVVDDGTCGNCHAGQITGAGPTLAIHSKIRGDGRSRTENGNQFVLSIEGATNTGPGETPVITFRVDRPDGSAYDIVNDPEFTQGSPSLNLYVGWESEEVYNGLADGTNINTRDTGAVVEPYSPAHPFRMYLAALQTDAVQNADGSYTVTYFAALPATLPGDVFVALGGHPYYEFTDNDGVTAFDQAWAVSQIFYTGTARDTRFASENCNGCHERLAFHGGNRSGNYEMCLACHNADLTAEGEGFSFGYMVHSIHTASPTFAGGAFAEVTYPQAVTNCETCHTPGGFVISRDVARAVSTDEGLDAGNWQDDTATTANAAVCGVCHTTNAAIGHFKTNGGMVDVTKDPGLLGNPPTGQEACAVCHGPGSVFDTTLFHRPGPGE